MIEEPRSIQGRGPGGAIHPVRDPSHGRTASVPLRRSRKERGLSQDRLANLAGIDRAYMGGIERAERHPTWEVIERLLAALDVGWSDFGRALQPGANEHGANRPARAPEQRIPRHLASSLARRPTSPSSS
jgi:transcriptional regulator with XRE-family HTH domain